MPEPETIVWGEGDKRVLTLQAYNEQGSAYAFSNPVAVSNAARLVLADYAGGSVVASLMHSTASGGRGGLGFSTDNSLGRFFASCPSGFTAGLTPGENYVLALVVPSTGLGSGISAKGADPTGREIQVGFVRVMQQVR